MFRGMRERYSSRCCPGTVRCRRTTGLGGQTPERKRLSRSGSILSGDWLYFGFTRGAPSPPKACACLWLDAIACAQHPLPATLRACPLDLCPPYFLPSLAETGGGGGEKTKGQAASGLQSSRARQLDERSKIGRQKRALKNSGQDLTGVASNAHLLWWCCLPLSCAAAAPIEEAAPGRYRAACRVSRTCGG